ncbi:MAG: glycosyltransferase family 1 protein [Burkholderiaceae bacterium]
MSPDTASASAGPLRICVVTETYPPEVNGVARTVERFVRGLVDLGHEVHLIRPRQSDLDEGEDGAGLSTTLCRGIAIPRYPDLRLGIPALGTIGSAWRSKRPDVVHVVTEGPLGAAALIAARRRRIPVSTDFRTNFHLYAAHYGLGWIGRPVAAYLRAFHNSAALTLVPTDQMRRSVEAIGIRNAQVVARGIDTTLFHPSRRSRSLRDEWGAGDSSPVLLSVGRLAAEKNLELTVAAYRRALAADPSARLVFVGSGPIEAQLRAQCPDAVFAGMRHGADLARHYASADLFVFPSLTETFGNVVIEAMASGLAVLAYDEAAARELIVPGRNGLTVPRDDAKAFADAAFELGTSMSGLRRLGEAARETALRHSWPDVVRRFELRLRALATAATPLAHESAAGAQPNRPVM